MNNLECVATPSSSNIELASYNGHRKGSSSSSDLSMRSIEDTVDAAFDIARYTAEDPLFGLADKNLMATNMKDLDLHNAWDISIDHMIDLAKICESAALDVSQKITNSEGASISSSDGIFIYANSHGFMGGYPTSRHSIGCSVIAEEKSMMQRDYWYSSARHVEDLESVDSVGKLAGTRTLSRLGAKKIHTCHAPVIFE
ncbi:MAG: metalloprotease PmbA, partial [Betaproteobacteria bacterium]|nr:metalloprotease PmbA [Betaproteobacteria bacterium]